MKKSLELNHLRFTIVGAARSGLSCAKLLKKFAAQVFVTEGKKLTDESKKMLEQERIPYEQGGHSLKKIMDSTDVLVISPGILLSSPLVIQAKQNHILVVSEVEVASWFFPENVVCFGITGTNGKSTTANYLSSLLQLNSHATACGNIGKPVSEVVLELYEKNLTQDKYYLSIELSSYQLETLYSLRPLCTCFLNLQNDHLARYENMDEYLKAKWRLILLTRSDGMAIIERNVLKQAIQLGLSLPECKILVIENPVISSAAKNLDLNRQNPSMTPRVQSKILDVLKNGSRLPVSIYQELKTLPFEQLTYPATFNTAEAQYNSSTNSAKIKFVLHTNSEVKSQDDKREFEWNIKDSCLNGAHNIVNILTASLMAEFVGLPRATLFNQWEKEFTRYVHLPNRLEPIGKKNQTFIDMNKNKKRVSIINDSKATNVESTLVALKSFHKPIRLLLGGDPKGDSYLPISKLENENTIYIYPFGKAAPVISQELHALKNNLSKNHLNMLAAANQALLECKDGDIILLSPACSSFDEFKDYEHRGNVFRAWAISCFEENQP